MPMAFTANDRFLAVSRADGSIYLYSLRTFLPVEQVGEQHGYTKGDGGTDFVPRLKQIVFGADGQTLYGIVQSGTNFWNPNHAQAYTWSVPKVSP